MQLHRSNRLSGDTYMLYIVSFLDNHIKKQPRTLTRRTATAFLIHI